jgi:putative CocE/NonD family hydrolase
MHGVSWLAIVQWYFAGLQPPHLAAIAPWTGHVCDAYREALTIGGIPMTIFDQMISESLRGRSKFERMYKTIEKYPLMNPYWEDKIAKLENIKVPIYAAGGYGGFEGFAKAGSKDKWLRMTTENDWGDQYNPKNLEDLRRFFDRYLKGIDNGWESTPRVRLVVQDPGGVDQANIPKTSWPIEGTEYKKFYLDTAGAGRGALSVQQPAKASTTTYDAKSGMAVFSIKFDKDTYVVGYPKLHLWVEAEGAKDMDIFAVLQKLDDKGNVLEVTSAHSGPGPFGGLRASLRALDPKLSTDYKPVHAFRKNEFLSPGQIVALDIAILPTGIVWREGQELRLMVAGDLFKGPTNAHNEGKHIIHTGPQYDSYLQLPIIQI